MSAHIATSHEPAAQRPNPPAKRKGSRRWLVVSALLLVAIAAGVGLYLKHNKKAVAASNAQKSEKEPAAEAVTADVVLPHRGGMARISSMSGSIHPFESVDLFANVSGYLKSQEVEVDGKTIPVDIGVHVKKGDLLAVIDVPELYAARDQAAADVEQAQAEADQFKAAVDTAEAEEAAAEADVEHSKAEVGRYTAQSRETLKAYNRYKGLRAQSAVDQDVVDQKEDAYESAKAAELAAEAGVKTSQAKLIAAKAKVEQAKSDLKASVSLIKVAQAKLEKADVYVGYTKIHAPFDGVITHRAFFPGAYIRGAADGNTASMLTVARTDVMRVVTKISDKDIPFANVGDPVEVTIDALPGEKFEGAISRFSESEIPDERTMITEIDLPNGPNSQAGGRLREGMYGLANIQLTPPTKNLVIPTSCLVGQTGGKANENTVLLLHDGVATPTKVETGTDDGIQVEILSGLRGTDQVIVPNGAVTAGSRVTVASAPAASH